MTAMVLVSDLCRNGDAISRSATTVLAGIMDTGGRWKKPLNASTRRAGTMLMVGRHRIYRWEGKKRKKQKGVSTCDSFY